MTLSLLTKSLTSNPLYLVVMWVLVLLPLCNLHGDFYNSATLPDRVSGEEDSSEDGVTEATARRPFHNKKTQHITSTKCGVVTIA